MTVIATQAARKQKSSAAILGITEKCVFESLLSADPGRVEAGIERQ